MMRVSFLMLLAMALAATAVHARLDLFAIGQLLTPNTQPGQNVGCQKIPFLLCDRVCDRCICDRRVPEHAECTCAQWKPFGEHPRSDGAQVHVIEKEKSQIAVESASGTIPYTECIKTCDECFCTQKWPPESNVCICINHSKSKKPAVVVEEVTELNRELALVSKPLAKSVGGFIPYPECIEKCDECVICTKIYPIEAALCYCGKKTASNSKKPALEYAEKLLTKLDVVAIPVAKSVGGFIPYPECIEKCDECVICTLPYPIEKALCYCGMNTKAEGRALPISLAD
ncbi:uncharacterized protein LOC126799351 isoform X2 [Argentina anserina]|uniref:uncharacterized protein LOC126799351 isoform X2 n=1 Tax=Argentina anserina TaxID=57926 RepID=UPI002176271B|nr:uncharacterized protein LOC126799351 isoform X2 [Potentilla anserina]